MTILPDLSSLPATVELRLCTTVTVLDEYEESLKPAQSGHVASNFDQQNTWYVLCCLSIYLERPLHTRNIHLFFVCPFFYENCLSIRTFGIKGGYCIIYLVMD